jgi:hypothetical protein
MTKKGFTVVFAAFLVLALTVAVPVLAATPVEKMASPLVQAVGLVADVPGVVIRGADRYNVDTMNAYLAALRANYNARVAYYEQQLKNHVPGGLPLDISNPPAMNYAAPKFDTFGMRALMVWGGIKGALNYDWQAFDRVVGTVKNVATPGDPRDYAPGVWETGPVSRYMWVSDAANAFKLAAVIACPIAAYNGAVLFGLPQFSGAAGASLTGLVAETGQVTIQATEVAYRNYF